MTDDIRDILSRLRENERVTALQGQTLGVLVEDAKLHAPQTTVDKLAAIQSQHGERLAVIDSRMTDKADRWYQPLLDFAADKMGGKGFMLTVIAALLFGLGFLLYTFGDRVIDLMEKSVTVQTREAQATEQLRDDVAAPLSPARDTVAIVPAP